MPLNPQDVSFTSSWSANARPIILEELMATRLAVQSASELESVWTERAEAEQRLEVRTAARSRPARAGRADGES